MNINNNKYSQYVVYDNIFGISVLDYPRLVVYLPILPPEGYLFTKLYVQILLTHLYNNRVLII